MIEDRVALMPVWLLTREVPAGDVGGGGGEELTKAESTEYRVGGSRTGMGSRLFSWAKSPEVTVLYIIVITVSI